LAGFFLASYIGLSVPVIGVGVATDLAPARDALLGFAALTLLGTLVVAASALRRMRVGSYAL
jgi:hypothetical protein